MGQTLPTLDLVFIDEVILEAQVTHQLSQLATELLAIVAVQVEELAVLAGALLHH